MKLLNVHFTELDEGEERFDTLVSPCGTVAVLNEIARQNKVDHTGYDAAFPNPAEVKAAILEDVEATLAGDEKPVILFSTLVYNAEATLALAGELKREFSERVHVVLGGQLVPFAAEAYKRNKNIDAVAIGDGEVLVPQIIRDIANGTVKKTYIDWLANHPTERGQFAFVNYDEYHKIRERMRAQKESSGFSQLCVQGLGGPGCSWAANNKNGACDFCALQNIEEMNTRSLGEQMEVEARLQTEFSPDRFFDVANQFLPFLNPRQNAKWLRAYIKERNKRGITTPKYAYLTVTSIDETIAPLLKEAGIEEVYLGVDHFDSDALKEENKSHRSRERLERTLNALRANGLHARMGLVVGSARETGKTLQALEEGAHWLKSEHMDVVRAVGVFPIYVLPGSKVYDRVRKIPEAQSIIEQFEARGFFTREERDQLTRIYIQEHSELSADEVSSTAARLQTSLASDTIAYDFNRSPGPEVLKT